MTRFYTEITVRVIDLERSQLERVLEPLADAVYDLTGVIDADLGVDLRKSLLSFTMAVDASDEPTALATCLAAVRSAIHVVGGLTPGWEQHFEAIAQEVRRAAALA